MSARRDDSLDEKVSRQEKIIITPLPKMKINHLTKRPHIITIKKTITH